MFEIYIKKTMEKQKVLWSVLIKRGAFLWISKMLFQCGKKNGAVSERRRIIFEVEKQRISKIFRTYLILIYF